MSAMAIFSPTTQSATLLRTGRLPTDRCQIESAHLIRSLFRESAFSSSRRKCTALSREDIPFLLGCQKLRRLDALDCYLDGLVAIPFRQNRT